MIIKPGKYVQRDGGIATVAFVDSTREMGAALGWDANSRPQAWHFDGSRDNSPSSHDLISEYREPLKGWVRVIDIYGSKSSAESSGSLVVEVCEVRP